MKKTLASLREDPARFYALIFVLMILGGVCLFFLAKGSLLFLLILVFGLIILGNILVVLL